MSKNDSSGAGIGIGGVLAFLLSWEQNHDLIWGIIHALFGWLYVVYHWITYENFNLPF